MTQAAVFLPNICEMAAFELYISLLWRAHSRGVGARLDLLFLIALLSQSQYEWSQYGFTKPA